VGTASAGKRAPGTGEPRSTERSPAPAVSPSTATDGIGGPEGVVRELLPRPTEPGCAKTPTCWHRTACQPGEGHCRGVLGPVKATLAALGGSAGLDRSCALHGRSSMPDRSGTRLRPDISTLQSTGHFYFALTSGHLSDLGVPTRKWPCSAYAPYARSFRVAYQVVRRRPPTTHRPSPSTPSRSFLRRPRDQMRASAASNTSVDPS